MIKRINRKSVSSVLIVMSYVLDSYQLSFIPFTLGELAMLLIVIISFVSWVRGERKKIGSSYFVLYFAAAFLVSCFFLILQNPQDVSGYFRNWIKLLAIVYIIDIASRNDFDSNVLQKWIVWSGVILSASVIVQAVFNLAFDIQIYPYLDLDFLPINYRTVKEVIALEKGEAAVLGYWRYCTIFPEPAFFARYVLLSLIVAMFGKGGGFNQTKRWVFSMVILTALFLCRSASGIFTAIMICAVWAVPHRKITARRICLLFVLFIAAVIFLMNTDILNGALSRLETVTVLNRATTGNQRLLQGLAVFGKLSPAEKLFGVGFGNVRNYMAEHSIITSFSREVGNDYMNVFSRILVAGGLVGFLVYMIFLFRLLNKNKDIMNRVVMLLLCVQFATSDLFYSCIAATYLVFAQCPVMQDSEISAEILQKDGRKRTYFGRRHTYLEQEE